MGLLLDFTPVYNCWPDKSASTFSFGHVCLCQRITWMAKTSLGSPRQTMSVCNYMVLLFLLIYMHMTHVATMGWVKVGRSPKGKQGWANESCAAKWSKARHQGLETRYVLRELCEWKYMGGHLETRGRNCVSRWLALSYISRTASGGRLSTSIISTCIQNSFVTTHSPSAAPYL